ncbi:MAG: glutamyl-tRNA reductase [Myxococcota bacterium]
MSRSSTLSLYSFSHKNTSLEERDALAFSADAAAAFVASVHAEIGAEAAVISTCNRTEFYLFGPAEVTDWTHIGERVADAKGLPLSKLPQPHVAKNNDAARHIFRVSASLESLALGENQILGQVKDAHEVLLDVPGKFPTLDRLFQYAVRAGKEVRTDTRLCEGTVSVSSVAVELAEKIFGDFTKRSVLIVGAGDTAEKAAMHFSSAGARNFTVVNRSEDTGKALAREFNGSYRPLDELGHAVADADVMLVATGSPNFLVTPDVMKRVVKYRHEPVFLIDISNPRNIDPAVSELQGVFLYNMDDLQGVVASHMQARKQEVPAAVEIVGHFVSEWDSFMRQKQITPTISTLARYFEDIRHQELARHHGKLDEEERNMLEQFSKGLVKKLLHNPIMYLRQALDNETLRSEDLNLVWSLYNLQEFEEDTDDN